VASAWIERRTTKSGKARYRVMFRLGGRESVAKYGGIFTSRKDANARRAWIVGELAAMRYPDLAALSLDRQLAPTVAENAERWRASRVDVAEATRVLHRVALARVLPILGPRRIDQVDADDIVELVARMAAQGYKRETIAKSVNALAQSFDYAGLDPNPARDKRRVRLPREEREEMQPPTADHVEAVYWTVPQQHRFALLWLDWSGARVGSVDGVLVADYDEARRRVRLRRSISKTRRALWVELHLALAEELECRLGPREDRDQLERLFAGSGSDALRTSITKACAALQIPLFSPHDLRHRRISLLHRQGKSWAEIGALVGQRSARVTSDTYTHVLVDDRELDYRRLLGEERRGDRGQRGAERTHTGATT
jgi:integrase